jgi:hypothetical protein
MKALQDMLLKSKSSHSYTLERRWPEKAAGGMAFFLIFFASFLHQGKKEEAKPAGS